MPTGIVAKKCDLAYRPGERDMKKFKGWETADCVVAGISLRVELRLEVFFRELDHA